MYIKITSFTSNGENQFTTVEGDNVVQGDNGYMTVLRGGTTVLLLPPAVWDLLDIEILTDQPSPTG